jgi:dienelactone hydrolase
MARRHVQRLTCASICLLVLVMAFASLCCVASAAPLIETVQFASAPFRVGPLTARRNAEANIKPAPAQRIDGYLVKPDGAGPFPAVVLLHGCSGLPQSFKANAAASPWVQRFVNWGYVVLAVDSFTARGLTRSCTPEVDFRRVADSFGALTWLVQRADIDPSRIVVLGFGAGGLTTLNAVQYHEHSLFEVPAGVAFKAAIAFAPVCAAAQGAVTTPTLILVPELDDWSPVARCRYMIENARRRGAEITMVVYPGAAHAFDDKALQSTRRMFGHFSAYDRAARDDGVAQVERFLARLR